MPITATTSPHTNSAQDVAAIVAALEQRLSAQPNDMDGWLMLGNFHLALRDVESAIKAFARAHLLGGGKNATAALGLGWALSLRNGGRITSEADRLFESAIALAPYDPQALFFSGLAAAQRGDDAPARRRWQELKGMRLASKLAAALDAQVAALDKQVATQANQPAAATARVTVNLALAPRLAARVSTDTPLFVFAQLRNQQGPPLAVKRVTTAAIGSVVILSPDDSTIPGRAIGQGMQVIVTALIALAGRATAAKGDFYGQLAYTVGTDGPRELRIDNVL
jgi:cytochrome c-type biogenesis protein CcmH